MERRSLEFDRESFRLFARYQTLRLAMVGALATLLAVAGIVLVAVGEPIWGLAILVAEIAALVLAFFGVRSHGVGQQEPPEQAPHE